MWHTTCSRLAAARGPRSRRPAVSGTPSEGHVRRAPRSRQQARSLPRARHLAHGAMGIYLFFLGFASLAVPFHFQDYVLSDIGRSCRGALHMVGYIDYELACDIFILLTTRAWISRTLMSVLLPIIQWGLVATWPSLTYHGPEVNGPVLKIFL